MTSHKKITYFGMVKSTKNIQVNMVSLMNKSNYQNYNLPVVSINIANTVSCNEKHKSSLVYSPLVNKESTRSYKYKINITNTVTQNLSMTMGQLI